MRTVAILFFIAVVIFLLSFTNVFSHPQNAIYVPLDKFEVAHSASGYQPKEGELYLYVKDAEDMTVCAVYFALYNKDHNRFWPFHPAPFGESGHYTPQFAMMDGDWRFTLIRKPEDLAQASSIEQAHLVHKEGCYLVWEETR